MPGVGHIDKIAIAVGKPGQVALNSIGNHDTSDVPTSPWKQGAPHHGYITMTQNLFATNPLFASVQVDSDAHPLFPYGYPIADSAPGGTNRIDYIGIDGDRQGRPWGYFPQDQCDTPTCPDSTAPFTGAVGAFSSAP